MENKAKVLFLCTGNAVRSQMAEAFLKKHAGDQFEVYSAGLEPTGINPLTIKVMSEAGFSLTEQTSKNVAQFLGKVHFGYIIIVCSRAEKNCPIFPGVSVRLYWPFDDPLEFHGSEEEKINKFRHIRDQIEKKIIQWLKDREIKPTGGKINPCNCR
jgi:arsenate reductase